VNLADLMAAQGAFGTDFYDRSTRSIVGAMLWTEYNRPVIKIGPKGALGSHEIQPNSLRSKPQTEYSSWYARLQYQVPLDIELEMHVGTMMCIVCQKNEESVVYVDVVSRCILTCLFDFHSTFHTGHVETILCRLQDVPTRPINALFTYLYSVRGLKRSELGGSHGCPGHL